MRIAKGPDENLRPVNAGVLFFSKEPEKFIERSWIELVIHKNEYGREFIEKYFKGPIHHQLRAVLEYFKTNVIQEKVVKIQGQAEADRFYNYPYQALEEAIANAVYHKSYEIGKPIEIQVWPDKIELLSYPGPVPPVDAQILKHQKRIVSRDYRNRRIGDFLKELHLTEGRGTGFPIIYNSMQRNGSDTPVFETDKQSTYFLTVLKAHTFDVVGDQANDQVMPLTINNLEELSYYLKHSDDQADDQVNNQALNILNKEVHDKVKEVLEILVTPHKRKEVLSVIGVKNHTDARKRYIDPLIDLGWIELTIPEKPTHKEQKYRLTAEGRKLLSLIGNRT
jgi:ATP-dependent DNA helicase RecG